MLRLIKHLQDIVFDSVSSLYHLHTYLFLCFVLVSLKILVDMSHDRRMQKSERTNQCPVYTRSHCICVFASSVPFVYGLSEALLHHLLKNHPKWSKKVDKHVNYIFNEKLEYGFLTIHTIWIFLLVSLSNHVHHVSSNRNFVVLHGSDIIPYTIFIVQFKWKIASPLNLKKNKKTNPAEERNC